MTNETRLLVALREYSRQLGTHLIHLNESHAVLVTAWSRLRPLYEGEAAEVFADAFGVASDRLREYASGSVRINELIERKIEEMSIYEHLQAGL